MWSCRVGRVATPTLRGFKCSRRRALSSCDKMREAVEGIQKIKNAMNEQVCGHHEIKHGILLSFISNQHCYIEGPPGSAKTMLAEIAAKSADQDLFFLQLHRDSRVNDLVGDEVLVREFDEKHGGELVRVVNQEGGILDCDIAVLDDITRAPGEALNVLFRVLNERQSGQSGIPLRSCVATGNPADNENYFNEALDPAALDRFTIQLKHQGLIGSGSWKLAMDVIDLYAASSDSRSLPGKALVNKTFFGLCNSLTQETSIPGSVKRGLVLFLERLVNEFRVNESNSILSDRTFLVSTLKVLKAHAIMHGRKFCTLKDLRVLSLLTTFRLPEEVHAHVPQLIESIIAELTDYEDNDGGDHVPPNTAGKGPKPNDEAEQKKTSAGQNNSMSSDKFDSGVNPRENTEAGDEEASSSQDGAGSSSKRGQISSRTDGDNTDSRGTCVYSENAMQHSKQEESLESLKFRENYNELQKYIDADKKMSSSQICLETVFPGHLERTSVEGIQQMLGKFSGSIQSCRKAQKIRQPGGMPRKFRNAKRLSELTDGKPSECLQWLDDPSPHLPRAFDRISRNRIGHLALVRDISGSMVSQPSIWASAVAWSVIKMCRHNNMALGYAEFNDKARLFYSGDHFFTKKYSEIESWAAGTNAEGTTNYEDPLKRVLHEFESGRKVYNLMSPSSPRSKENRHIILLTDGQPTEGDPLVELEREHARELGVIVHTIFVASGSSAYPLALEYISAETGGLQFRAIPKTVLGQKNSVIEVIPHIMGAPAILQALSEGRERGSKYRQGVLAGYGSPNPYPIGTLG